MEKFRYLEHFGERITLVAGWNQLDLPKDRITELKEIARSLRAARGVYDAWGFPGRTSRCLGTNVLFAGSRSTRKTMAAKVLANELSLDLYRIDLSRVVSKYIGETEKNLKNIFMEAETSHAILFFDEADALFRKRSEMKDRYERYANIEVTHLLQRMEEYPGLTILAVCSLESINPAFLRRIRYIVQFPADG